MRTVAVICAVAASAFIGPSAWADLFNPDDLDQSQEQWSQDLGCYGVGGPTLMAQTFTAGETGTLYGVELGNTTGGVVWGDVSVPVVQIFAGQPGSTDFRLAANPVSLPSDPVPSDGWLPVDFNFFVRDGWTYSIVVSTQNPDGSVSVGVTSNDSYTRGDLWATDEQGAWQLLSDVDPESEIPVYDMQFHTHVEAVPLPAGVCLGMLGLSVAGWRLKRQMG